MSEPNAGSDVVSMRLKAEKKGKATCHKAAGIGCWGSLPGSQYGFSARRQQLPDWLAEAGQGTSANGQRPVVP